MLLSLLILVATFALLGAALFAVTNLQPTAAAPTTRRVLTLLVVTCLVLTSVALWRLTTCGGSVAVLHIPAVCG